MTDFLNRLAQTLESSDWSVQHKNDGLIAKKTAVLSKWLLGSRKILHRMVIKFNPDKQELVLNETAAEISIGIPPPSFIASQWQQKNLDYREDRTDSGARQFATFARTKVGLCDLNHPSFRQFTRVCIELKKSEGYCDGMGD